MTENQHGKDEVVGGIRRKLARRQYCQCHRQPTLGAQLARVGVLGWIIVTPTLIGLCIGHFIDKFAGTGVFWSGALMVVGIAVGCWSAWKWMNSQ